MGKFLIESLDKNGEITHEEALETKGIKTIVDQKKINENQIKVANILFSVDKIFTGETNLVEEIDESDPEVFDKQPDTTDVPGLESAESAAQRRNQQGKDLKVLIEILTRNQWLVDYQFL